MNQPCFGSLIALTGVLLLVAGGELSTVPHIAGLCSGAWLDSCC